METKSVNRRAFFKRTAGIAAGAAAASTVLLSLRGSGKVSAAVGSDGAINDTLQMYADLGRALARPIEQRKWGMVIDIRKCIGCSACTVACIAENNLPPGVTYRVVKEVEDGEYPDLRRFFMPTNCMQCDNPPCMKAANAVVPGAIDKRPDGIVAINYQKFKGKRVFDAAQKACPYAWVGEDSKTPSIFYYDEGRNYTDGTPAIQSYERQGFTEYGKKLTRKETKGVGRKCHFCIQRVEASILPACVTTCTGQAMHFGDLNDQESLVSRLLKQYKSARIEEAKGTGPKIYYLDDEPQETCARCHT
jgi:molybdopterin-containing oxidoreductase family iron-sulfur binding subunit